jgi:hypothetical protein
MKTIGIKIIIILFLITFSNEIFCGTTDVKEYDKNLIFDFGGDRGNVYNSIPGYKTIVKTDIENAFNEVWNEFTTNGSSKLPKCVVEAFEALRDKEIKIMYFAEAINAEPRGVFKGKEKRIEIYNTYMATPCQIQSLVFHEMLHKAFYEMSEKEKEKDQKDRIFCVKIINEYITECPDGSEVTDYECTNTFNFAWDEGIVEDCELELFSCGLDYYKGREDSYNEYRARGFNPSEKDCTEDNLCKKKDKDCDYHCPEDEKCPQKPPDHMDDNYSFSSGTLSDYKLAPEALIYKGGFYHEAVNLFGGLLWDGDNSAEELLKISKTLIIPSGDMYSREDDTTLKNILEEYVRRGGSLIALCQQYGIACGPIGICEQKRKKSNFFC